MYQLRPQFLTNIHGAIYVDCFFYEFNFIPDLPYQLLNKDKFRPIIEFKFNRENESISEVKELLRKN